jgi:hypothetical protein
MKISLLALLVLLSASGIARAEPNQAYAFVTEYVRELSSYEAAREKGDNDSKSSNTPDEILGTCMAPSTHAGSIKPLVSAASS